MQISTDPQNPMHICPKQQGLVQICNNTGQIGTDLQQYNAE
jgi:hypothetical protein